LEFYSGKWGACRWREEGGKLANGRWWMGDGRKQIAERSTLHAIRFLQMPVGYYESLGFLAFPFTPS